MNLFCQRLIFVILYRRLLESDDNNEEKSSPSTESSDLPSYDSESKSGKKIENRREKLFIIDLLKNADEKKEQV